MLNVLVVIGTRPEALKMIPLILKMRQSPRCKMHLIATAQHRELLDQVLEPFNIVPDIDLDTMVPGQSLFDITSRVLVGIGQTINRFAADVLLVHGDTTTTFSAALAGFYAGIKVAHVEAGLRSFDKLRPFPEEINRRLVTRLADMHFAPTELSRKNLLDDGVADSAIFVTGNTALDLIPLTTYDSYTFKNPALAVLDFKKRIILTTAHRRENLSGGIKAICRAILRIATKFPDVHFVWPVHPAPAVTEPVRSILGACESVTLVDPVDIFDMHNLLRRSYLCLTDSGGLQEEAPSFNIPVIVLRDVTERPEGLDAGTLVLAGTDEANIYNATHKLLVDTDAYDKMAAVPNPYGDGRASQRIFDVLLSREVQHD